MDKAIGYVKVYTSQDSADLLPGQIKQKNEIYKYRSINDTFIHQYLSHLKKCDHEPIL